MMNGVFRQALPLLGRSALMEELNGTKLRGKVKKLAFLEEFPLGDDNVDLFLESCTHSVLSLRIHLASELQTGLRDRLLSRGRFLLMIWYSLLPGLWMGRDVKSCSGYWPVVFRWH